ncbi:hypothetical protein AX16_001762 [Volvariella volvacea WC 439]|nr:hypothetical protein AX16_001762 [Volvariella volvacea WC 439]
MREENRRMWEELSSERRKVEKLTGVVRNLYDVVGKALPGTGAYLPSFERLGFELKVPIVPPFPQELVEESGSNPNIYVTSPQSATSRYPPPLSMNFNSQPLHSISPNSSPTGTDFPPHLQSQPHPTLSRQQSFQHVSYSRDGHSSAPTPLPPSPTMPMDLFDDERSSLKRQRVSDDGSGLNGVGVPSHAGDSLSALSSPVTGPPGSAFGSVVGSGKKLNRARSDSAPLGYGFSGMPAQWSAGTNTGVATISGRPRSGSGISRPGIPNIGSLSRNGPPLLSLPTVPSGSPTR